MKTVKEQILSFLQKNPSVYHGGQLQRMDFTTRGRGLATGDSIKRRLNELVDEGKVFVTYNHQNQAMFSANPASVPPKKPKLKAILVGGNWVAREV